MSKEKLPINQRIEEEFGIIEVSKSLDDEKILGVISEIPAARGAKATEYGDAKATITDKRLIIEAQVYEEKGEQRDMGRFTFYYETWLDRIQDVKLKSYDTKKKKMSIPAIVCIIALAAVLVISGIAIGGVAGIACYVLAGLSLFGTIPFLPHKYRSRSFSLTFTTLGGKFVIGNTKDSDLFVAVSIDSVEKLTLLARGVRKAQTGE